VTYALTRLVFEEQIVLDISPDWYRELVGAAAGVSSALDIEEKFNLVLENFEEFEGELLRDALGYSLFQREDWSSRMTELHRLNRRLVNLLATCRLYVDQVPHNLSQEFAEDPGLATAFEVSKSREFDATLGYRVMDALRNYMQHRSLPIHVLSHESAWRDLPAGRMREHTVAPQTEPQTIGEDGKFRAQTLTELEALGTRVDMTPLARQYVAGLGAVHRDLRTGIAATLARWDGIIAQAGTDFLAAGATDLTGLVAVRISGEKYADIVHISPSPTSRRKWLEQKNRYIEHYEAALVASRRTWSLTSRCSSRSRAASCEHAIIASAASQLNARTLGHH
jgi:hypothetical protein